MKKNILLLLLMAIGLGACKKERQVGNEAVDIKDYIVLFQYGIYAGPEYPMYGIFTFGDNHAAEMITTKRENVAYFFEHNTIKFPILKSEIAFDVSPTAYVDFYFDPAHESPGGVFGNIRVVKKPVENQLKGKIFGGVAKASNGQDFNLYYRFDQEVYLNQYHRYTRGNTIASLTAPQTPKHHCYFFGNTAFVKDTYAGIRESGVLINGKLEVLLYNLDNHSWSYASLTEIKD